MEKFMLLFRGSEAYQKDQSPEVLDVLKANMIDWVTDLSEKGFHAGSEPLQPSGKQVSGVNRIVTDGPYGKEKEVVGGCTIVLANDIEEAVAIANTCPILNTNATIEVRAIQIIQ